ncbi:hypothetical protein ACIRU3_47180 [Streptomyces sp. NPDC101151]|uniref:hypothetical protein n=1 Tax=Streptomyces sp. NPDC101151 TaxID=3366115 RepID=UPI00382C218D
MTTRASDEIFNVYPRQLITTAEVARRCGVQHLTVLQWVRRGKLVPVLTDQQGHLFADYHVDAFIEQRKRRASSGSQETT